MPLTLTLSPQAGRGDEPNNQWHCMALRTYVMDNKLWIEDLSRISLKWLAGLRRTYILAIVFTAVQIGSWMLFEYATDANRHWWEVAIMLPLAIIVFAVTYVVKICIAILPVSPISIVAFALVWQTIGNQRNLATWLRLLSAATLLCLAAAGSWYLYDYYVPDYRLFNDDRPPWQHGLTLPRFGAAFGIQALIFVQALCSFHAIMQAAKRLIQRESAR